MLLMNVYKTIKLKARPRPTFVLIGIVACVFVLFYWYSPLFSFKDRPIKTSSLSICISDRMKSFQEKIHNFNAVSFTSSNKMATYPIIGNGLFGCAWLGQQNLMLHWKRSLSWSIPEIKPLLSIKKEGGQSQEGMVVDFQDGKMVRIQCVKLSSLCISSTLTAYAHRTRPNLLVQRVALSNPTSMDTSVDLTVLQRASLWKGATVISKTFSFKKSDNSLQTVEYDFVYGKVSAPNGLLGQYIYLVVAEPRYPSQLNVPKGEMALFQYLTGIITSELLSYQTTPQSVNFTLQKLLSALEIILRDSLPVLPDELEAEHAKVWNQLWATGLQISHSYAPDAINGIHINSTFYHILSHSTAPLSRKNISRVEHSWFSDALGQSDRCFQGHDTLNAKVLWHPVNNESDAVRLVNAWMLTLEKQGCERMIKAGADGVIQALVLSLGSFEFSGEHLEFDMHPNDLHRDFHFRGVRFDDTTTLDIWVKLDEEYRPGIRVSVRSNGAGKPVYACEAACTNGPISIPPEGAFFPVRITQPRTALLYIAHQAQHLRELRHVLHVSDVRDVPAYDSHMIHFHRHGDLHGWTGLPTSFWIAILLIVTIFHAVLCRLLYQEYCGQGINSVSSLPPVPSRVAHFHQAVWARATHVLGNQHHHNYHHFSHRDNTEHYLY